MCKTILHPNKSFPQNHTPFPIPTTATTTTPPQTPTPTHTHTLHSYVRGCRAGCAGSSPSPSASPAAPPAPPPPPVVCEIMHAKSHRDDHHAFCFRPKCPTTRHPQPNNLNHQSAQIPSTPTSPAPLHHPKTSTTNPTLTRTPLGSVTASRTSTAASPASAPAPAPAAGGTGECLPPALLRLHPRQSSWDRRCVSTYRIESCMHTTTSPPPQPHTTQSPPHTTPKHKRTPAIPAPAPGRSSGPRRRQHRHPPQQPSWPPGPAA